MHITTSLQLCQACLYTMMVLVSSTAANAQQTGCTPEQFAALVDGTGAYLRDFSFKRKPILHKKFEVLARKKKWPATSARERGYQLLQDKRATELDARARKLLIELDAIDARSGEAPSCDDLNRLKTVTLELRAVTETKFAYLIKRADQAIGPSQPKVASAPKQPQNPTVKAPRPATTPAPWKTTTENSPRPPVAVIQALPRPELMPPKATYTAKEIREAGRGFFGNISAGLASIIQYTFQNYGAPNGYILGTEGGGAFLAGLSFGKGQLNTKLSTPMKVFWQGPTVGYDFGLQGGRVMFLVYNLKRPEKIFARYGGISGSAYVVGGVGLTYHRRGSVVLAPIRTGLGLRVGANIGYLKFTPRRSINPF